MRDKENSGAAYPMPMTMMSDSEPHIANEPDSGLNVREYTAIHTGVPDSGTDWIDAMIRAGNRRVLAGQVIGGLVNFGYTDCWDDTDSARHAKMIADALLAALEEVKE